MLASLLIVFREVIEAGLIVGIVLAATKGVRERALWVGYGVAGGILGACFVALRGPVAGADGCPLQPPPVLFDKEKRQRVYVIGYPLGSDLSFSIHDSVWLEGWPTSRSTCAAMMPTRNTTMAATTAKMNRRKMPPIWMYFMIA